MDCDANKVIQILQRHLRIEEENGAIYFEDFVMSVSKQNRQVKRFFRKLLTDEKLSFFVANPSKFVISWSGDISTQRGICKVNITTRGLNRICKKAQKFLVIALRHLGRASQEELLNILQQSFPEIKYYFYLLTPEEKRNYFESNEHFKKVNRHGEIKLSVKGQNYSDKLLSVKNELFEDHLLLYIGHFLQNYGYDYNILIKDFLKWTTIPISYFSELSGSDIIAFFQKRPEYFTVDADGIVSIQTDSPNDIRLSPSNHAFLSEPFSTEKVIKCLHLFLMLNGATHYTKLLEWTGGSLSQIKLFFSEYSMSAKYKFFKDNSSHFILNSGYATASPDSIYRFGYELDDEIEFDSVYENFCTTRSKKVSCDEDIESSINYSTNNEEECNQNDVELTIMHNSIVKCIENDEDCGANNKLDDNSTKGGNNCGVNDKLDDYSTNSEGHYELSIEENNIQNNRAESSIKYELNNQITSNGNNCGIKHKCGCSSTNNEKGHDVITKENHAENDIKDYDNDKLDDHSAKKEKNDGAKDKFDDHSINSEEGYDMSTKENYMENDENCSVKYASNDCRTNNENDLCAGAPDEGGYANDEENCRTNENEKWGIVSEREKKRIADDDENYVPKDDESKFIINNEKKHLAKHRMGGDIEEKVYIAKNDGDISACNEKESDTLSDDKEIVAVLQDVSDEDTYFETEVHRDKSTGGAIAVLTEDQNTIPGCIQADDGIVNSQWNDRDDGHLEELETQRSYANNNTVNVQLNGIAENVRLNGIAENVQLNGIAEIVRLNGIAENVQLNGIADNVQLNGTAENVQLNGMAENVQLNGIVENVQLNGIAENVQHMKMDAANESHSEVLNTRNIVKVENSQAETGSRFCEKVESLSNNLEASNINTDYNTDYHIKHNNTKIETASVRNLLGNVQIRTKHDNIDCDTGTKERNYDVVGKSGAKSVRGIENIISDELVENNLKKKNTPYNVKFQFSDEDIGRNEPITNDELPPMVKSTSRNLPTKKSCMEKHFFGHAIWSHSKKSTIITEEHSDNYVTFCNITENSFRSSLDHTLNKEFNNEDHYGQSGYNKNEFYFLDMKLLKNEASSSMTSSLNLPESSGIISNNGITDGRHTRNLCSNSTKANNKVKDSTSSYTIASTAEPTKTISSNRPKTLYDLDPELTQFFMQILSQKSAMTYKNLRTHAMRHNSTFRTVLEYTSWYDFQKFFEKRLNYFTLRQTTYVHLK